MRKVLAGALLVCGMFSSVADGNQQVTATPGSKDNPKDNGAPRVALHENRGSELDLAVAGDLPGVPRGSIRYVSREELLKLPQVTYLVSDDANFKSAVEISGVLLEELSSALGTSPASTFLVAVCADQYHGNFPSEYVREHHPVLVLRINGQPPKGWPKNAEAAGAFMGPYLISHAKFTPSFRVFAHQDEAQIPWGVERLEFRDERKTLAAIAPRGLHAGDANVQAGYRIAQQNCFRCHNMGEDGGRQSGQPWLVLAAWAAASPEHFASYVRNPQANNPNSQMAASPKYDDVTMKALTDYFSTFIAAGKP
ncbi:cytochrome c, class I [Candidatus Koribacter versatilis Ellin345]|uniref:Cytochrome c, class I n=1 Tax=Koribacter versatilis (strain Ellin345) TaxID=204669 RepID=Q1ITM2_KORVE|nr:c-type cytochrome [Candidatus Koribacter versatilis]ABF39778.1 cytochrome c, class I [Candidatus Koribacter versatilis Ellin345]